MRFRTMLEDVGPKLKSVQTFIHYFFSCFSWWMMLDAFSLVSIMLDQNFRKKGVNFNKIRTFKRLNAYSNILVVRSVVSFVLQNGFAKRRNSQVSKFSSINTHSSSDNGTFRESGTRYFTIALQTFFTI